MHIRQFTPSALICGAIFTSLAAIPAHAQEVEGPPAGIDMEDTVFAGDYLSVGVGVALNPSYTGSDDYVFTVLPIAQGSLGGIEISPRAGGISLNFLQDPEEGLGLQLGLAGRLRANRASQIKDEVVLQYGELDRAIEVGPSIGLQLPAVLNPYDRISVGVDAMWDLNGAHEGMAVSPSITYFTPLSRSTIARLALSTEWTDGNFHDYYFSVDDAEYIGPGVAPLPEFAPEGGGFTSASATLLLAIDLDGDIANGGLGLVLAGGYSRVLGDAADTPFTDIRGSKDQFLAAIGVGYTF